MRNLPDISFQQFFGYCIQNNLPFAFYRLPGDTSIKVIAQKTPLLHKLATGKARPGIKGFLFAPFREDKHYSRILIQPDIYTTLHSLPALDFARGKAPRKPIAKTNLPEASKKDYKNLVLQIQDGIKQNRFTKIVAARLIKKNKPGNFSPPAFFQKLCMAYTDAFVSMVYTPQYGLWIGASPEVLLQVQKDSYKMYSLAGTRANSPVERKKAWGEKEKNEQQLISDYISASLKKLIPQKPRITGPETVVAGNVLHLRTTFVYKAVPHNSWLKVAEQLHPTPAVGGLPKKEAIAFITKNEQAPRGFYAGYLGPVNIDGEVNLFVNLRCTQILKNKLALQVGSGITAGSQPNAEWKETKLKAKTLLGVLKDKKRVPKVSKNLSSLPANEHHKKSRTRNSRSL